MKLFFAIASILLAFSAHANDRKIGNIVAVERTITNIYTNCLDNVSQKDTTKPQNFFSCAIKIAAPSEMPVTKGIVLNLKDNECSVDAESVNGNLFVIFSAAKGMSTFEVAKSCLQKAIVTKGEPKVIVYTVE